MRPFRSPLPVLGALFAVSGAAGLIQEVAWSRALGQSLGHSLHALTAVLVCFLGGLGLGAACGSRLSGAARTPLRLYAFLEIGIAVGAALAPRAAALGAAAMERFGPDAGSAGGLVLLRFLIAAIILIPPTFAMGATLPCLVREALRRQADPAASVAVLYGANTAGAAIGAALGSFVLLPLAGTRLTFAVAGALSLLAALAALVLDAARPAPATGPASPPSTATAGGGPDGAGLRAALMAAMLTGCAGAVLQVGWIRTAALAFGSTIYALGATLTAYIAGLGIGPFLVRRALRRGREPRRLAGTLIGATGLAALAILPALGLLPGLAALLPDRVPGGVALLLGLPFLLFFAALFPAAAAQGATFPALALLAGAGRETPRGTGRIYAASTAGSVAGFLLAGFVLLPALGTRRTLAITGLTLLATAAGLEWGRAPDRRPRRGALLAAMAAIALVGLSGPAWRREIVSGGGILYASVYRAAGGAGMADILRRRGEILFYREDGDGLITVRRNRAGALSLQINGKTEASTGGDLPTQLLAGHLPLLLHPRPGRVLVVGLASGITLGAVERHPVDRVTVFEIAPGVVAAARRFDAHHGQALDDPRLELRLDDARAGLLAGRERFDVITSQPSNPWVAGVANLFTEEFYRLTRARLAPGGIVCQWIQAYRLAPEDLRGIVAAFLKVYPEATLWEESAGGGDYFLIGGDGTIRIDPDRLRAGGGPAAREDLRRAGIMGAADLLARFVAGPGGLARLAAGAVPHGDDRLTLEARAPLALFRDDPRAAIDLLDRHREPVLEHLAPETAPDPVLWREVATRLRSRRDRLAILADLRDADLWALHDPFLAAGADALRRGQPIEALPALQRAAAENPGSAATRLLLAEAYRATGLDGAARVALRAALEIDPALAPAWNLLGRSALDLGAARDAQRAFAEALRHARAPGLRAAARNNLGVILLQTGDVEAAEARFREALADDPGLSAAHANLGLALKRRGDARGAEAATREALAHDPLNHDARYNLAMLLRSEGRRREADGELRRILELRPDDASAAAALRAP